MPFTDFEDLDLMLGSTVTPRPRLSRALALLQRLLIPPESAETDTPPSRSTPLQRDYHRRPIWQDS